MKILLVKDDEVLRAAMQHLLPRWGYEVNTADCDHTALEKIQKFPFNLILLDGQLPDIKVKELEPVPKFRAVVRTYPLLIRDLSTLQ